MAAGDRWPRRPAEPLVAARPSRGERSARRGAGRPGGGRGGAQGLGHRGWEHDGGEHRGSEDRGDEHRGHGRRGDDGTAGRAAPGGTAATGAPGSPGTGVTGKPRGHAPPSRSTGLTLRGCHRTRWRATAPPQAPGGRARQARPRTVCVVAAVLDGRRRREPRKATPGSPSAPRTCAIHDPTPRGPTRHMARSTTQHHAAAASTAPAPRNPRPTPGPRTPGPHPRPHPRAAPPGHTPGHTGPPATPGVGGRS